MTDWSALTLEPMIAASPIWIRLRDTFTRRAPTGRLSVTLERRVGAEWIAFEHRHKISSTGDLAFVNLGRTRDPAGVGTFDVRVTVTGPGTITEIWNGEASLVTTVTAWAPDAPVAAQLPDNMRLFPGPSYPFPGGTPLLAGQIIDSNGAPAPRARVWATATVQNALLVEEARSDGDGRFRLPLRWSVGATTVHATRGAEAGAIQVFMPAALSTTHQIQLT